MIKCGKDENGKPVHFLFNNHQNKVITEETDGVYDFAWKVSKKGIEGFFKFLKNTKAQSLQMTINALTDRKFKGNISESRKCHPGPPARYQLVTKRESLDGEREGESRLRRWTFGERDHRKVNKTILLVGQTGTGKSTMINALVNYVMGVEIDDEVWFEIIQEEKRCQTKSQTSTVTVYETFGFEDRRVPYSLTIIDTPGFGDTDGVQKDEIIVEKLCDLFRSGKGVREIDAVGFLVKAGTSRLDDKHVKENWRYENKTRKVKKIHQGKKTTYEKNKQNKAEAEKKMKDVEETKDNKANAANKMERELAELRAEKENLERDKIRWVEEAYQHVVSLEEIALNAGSLSTHIHLDFLIEKMKETGEIGRAHV